MSINTGISSYGAVQSSSRTYDIYKNPERNQARNAEPQQNEGNFWGEDGFSFADVIDVLNPLQHIPVVSDIYQSITGDKKSVGSDVAGGALFGGVIGLALAFLNSVIEDVTGKSPTENLFAMFSDEENVGPPAPKNELGNLRTSITPQTSQTLIESQSGDIPENTHADIAHETYQRIQKLNSQNSIPNFLDFSDLQSEQNSLIA